MSITRQEKFQYIFNGTKKNYVYIIILSEMWVNVEYANKNNVNKWNEKQWAGPLQHLPNVKSPNYSCGKKVEQTKSRTGTG